MKTIKNLNRMLLTVCLCLLSVVSAAGDTFQEDRQYDLVVVTGAKLYALNGADIHDLYLYAYTAGTDTWQIIPFQIDEKSYAVEPDKPSKKRWYYFVPEGSDISGHDGLLGDHDELAFPARDAGDRAQTGKWIGNEASRQYARLEIGLTDPLTGQKAYVYLYRSATINDPVPAPYQFTFNQETQVLDNKYYSIRLSMENGLIEDIIIHEPYGSDVDIFDTHKLRFGGVFEFGPFTIPIAQNGGNHATERDNLYLYTDADRNDPEKAVYYHYGYTQNPVVRLVREVKQTIRFGTYIMNDLGFFIATKFDPFGGEYAGGALLNSDSLKTLYDEDTYIQMDLLRQSFDFDEAATGMHFYNPHNNGVLIDGVPDEVNTTVSIPIQEWTMASGDQGTVFTYFSVADTNWQSASLYYYDNSAGGQGDGTSVDGGDTGDGQSFGDQGILVESHALNNVDLNIGFSAHFLPGNLAQADGTALSENIKHPIEINTSSAMYPTAVESDEEMSHPVSLILNQNYPNPFNSSTTLSFSTSAAGRVTVKIYSVHGSAVYQITDMYNAGTNQIRWDGRDVYGNVLPSGIYLYEVEMMHKIVKRKMLMIK